MPFKVSEHFISTEFACKHCGEFKANPKLVIALEAFRAIVGRPVMVDDGYRCPVHNAEVGGEPNSQHLLGNAVDVRVTGLTGRMLYQAARQVRGINGIGVDLHKGYIHLDVREIPAKWSYDIHGHDAPWDTRLDFTQEVDA